MSSIDTLLDNEISTVSEGESTDNRIILTIDEPSRTIKFDGSLILGVKGDRFAERIYFRAPRLVYDDIDLTAETTKIYIDYINAAKEPYIQESSDAALQEDGTVLFSWHLSEYVTIEKGTVQFNVCAKKVVDTELVNEWHTTYFTGTVLPAVDVSGSTPEVITSESVTIEALTAEVAGYKTNLETLNATLADTEAFIEETIDKKTFSSDKVLYGDESLTDTLGELENQNGVRYLGVFTSQFYDNGDDYLASVTEPGIYSFNIKTSETSSKFCLLVVTQVLGYLYQTVFTDVYTKNMYKHTRYYQDNKWVPMDKDEFAFKSNVGVTHLGTFDTTFYNSANDYLDNYRTPGIYSFNTQLSETSSTFHLLVVTKVVGYLYQTVITNIYGTNMYKQTRYLDNGVWTLQNKNEFAFKSDLGGLGTFNTTPFDSSNDYLANITEPGVYNFAVSTNGDNHNVYSLIVSKDLFGTLEQTIVRSLYSGTTIQNRTYDSSTGTWNAAKTVKRFVFQDELEAKVGWQLVTTRDFYVHEHADTYTLNINDLTWGNTDYSEFKIVIKFDNGAEKITALRVLGIDVISNANLTNNIPVLIEMISAGGNNTSYVTSYADSSCKTWYSQGSYQNIEIALDMGEETIGQATGKITISGRY